MLRPAFALWLFLLVSLVPDIVAKNKKQLLPDEVLRARTVLVVIRPDTGEPLTRPTANRDAQDDVEKAITKWGRFDLVMSSPTADLIIAVRKGNRGGSVVSHSPADDRPVISQPSADGGGRIGIQHGHPPDLTSPDPSIAGGPHLANEIGSAEDSIEVYRGGTDNPLDAPPVWRYAAKDALNPPQVAAVEHFRRAIEESERQHQQKP